jgi:hypothetical protein
MHARTGVTAARRQVGSDTPDSPRRQPDPNANAGAQHMASNADLCGGRAPLKVRISDVRHKRKTIAEALHHINPARHGEPAGRVEPAARCRRGLNIQEGGRAKDAAHTGEHLNATCRRPRRHPREDRQQRVGPDPIPWTG